MVERAATLVLRLAGPLQSWGGQSQFNRREIRGEPTKSGVLGLLAAAQGRRRHDPIEDLLQVQLGVRTDHPGSLLRDYHTVSDYRGRPLPSAAVSAKGLQKPTAPAKYTHVTERFYLQDAVFVAAIHGPTDLVKGLHLAVQRPAFPLALGRRACVPSQPLVLMPAADRPVHGADLWSGQPAQVLRLVPWQLSTATMRRMQRRVTPAYVDLPITVDDPAGTDVRIDVPSSFDPLRRSFTSRRVRQDWVRIRTPFDGSAVTHDPFALLGW